MNRQMVDHKDLPASSPCHSCLWTIIALSFTVGAILGYIVGTG